MHASTWGDWVSGLSVGARAEDPVPHPAPSAPPGPCVGGDSPKLLPAHPEAGLGAWFPPASGPQSSGTLTQTLIGGFGCAPGPRAVLEEGQAALTVRARGVVLASAGQPALPVRAALAGVPVALAPGKRTRGQGVCNLGEAPAEEGSVGREPQPAGGPLTLLLSRAALHAKSLQSRLTLCDLMGCNQAPLSMGFSRQEYWSGLPFPSPGDLSDPGIEPRSPALQADSLPSETPGKPQELGTCPNQDISENERQNT